MIRAWLGAAIVLLAACDSSPTLTRPSPPVAHSALLPEPARQRISLGESVDVDLDMNIDGVRSCEVKEDPTPCSWLDVEVPRSGTLQLRIDFNPIDPMFLYLYQGTVSAFNVQVNGQQSPLIVRKAVTPGLVYITTGPNVPWGREGSVRFRVLATLE